MGLVSELKRRNVFRMGVLYVVAAWLIMQVAGVLMDLGALPAAAGPWVLTVLVIGFPIALVVSWLFEITPEGLALEKDVPEGASITHITGRRMDFLVIAVLSAGLILFAFDKWWPSVPTDKSIAVLPFVNMSADPGQEYFSDGISEELLSTLSRVPDLRVISRSSAFFYKDTALEAKEIAEDLNVAHILEGSVRKSGDDVRVTVRLIDASSNSQLWSESFDRPLGDIFAIQEEIARNVTETLRGTLLNQAGAPNETDPEAYALYLQARHLSSLVTIESVSRAISYYRQVLDIDPKYAPAWIGLGVAYEKLASLRFLPWEESRALAFEAIERAVSIAPDSGAAQNHMAYRLFTQSGDLDMAAYHFGRAMRLEPTNTNIIGNVSMFLTALGRLEEGIQFAEYQVSRDPANAIAYNNLGVLYRYAGRFARAEQAFRTCLTLSPSFGGANYELGATHLLTGDLDDAHADFRNEELRVFGQIGLAMVYHAQGERVASQQMLNEIIRKHGEQLSYYVAMVKAFQGDIDGAFEWLESAKIAGDHELPNVINEPLFANLHSDPRWQPFLATINKSPEQLAMIDFKASLPRHEDSQAL
jgi:TolB-like protein/Tfp pilus assembly protein PilF